MKKFLFIVFFITFPLITFALEKHNPEWVKTWQEWNMSAEYLSNTGSLSDSIVIKIGKTTRTIPWLWSNGRLNPWTSMKDMTVEKKKEKINCIKEKTWMSLCGIYEYKIIRLSPSWNYIEIEGRGYESGIWYMLDARTGKIILENDNWVSWSGWTPDRKQFVWITWTCDIGWCRDDQWVFMTFRWNFPKYKKLISYSTNASDNYFIPVSLSNKLFSFINMWPDYRYPLENQTLNTFALMNGNRK